MSGMMTSVETQVLDAPMRARLHGQRIPEEKSQGQNTNCGESTRTEYRLWNVGKSVDILDLPKVINTGPPCTHFRFFFNFKKKYQGFAGDYGTSHELSRVSSDQRQKLSGGKSIKEIASASCMRWINVALMITPKFFTLLLKAITRVKPSALWLKPG